MPELPATPHHESETHREVHLTRTAPSTFECRNARGGTLTLCSGDGPEFTPVEAMLAAAAACSGVDVDILTARRSEALSFEIVASGEKLRTDDGNRMQDVVIEFRVTFPDGEAGDAAREELPRAVARSHDRLCTVSRTLQLPTHVTTRLAE